MERQTIDEYLDGTLNAAARNELERAVVQDPATAKLLSQMKADRALRSAVYASYAPSAAEASALAASALAACADEAAAPVGKIGPRSWIRWGSAIAAGLALVVGAYDFGRMSAPVQTVEKVINVEVPNYSVVVLAENGTPQEERKFASLDSRNTFVSDLMQRGATAREAGNSMVVSLAEYDLTNQPGRF